jgi:hypothetical protein
MIGRGAAARAGRASPAVRPAPVESRPVMASCSSAASGNPSKTTESVPCRSVRQTVAPLAERRSRSAGAGWP